MYPDRKLTDTYVLALILPNPMEILISLFHFDIVLIKKCRLSYTNGTALSVYFFQDITSFTSQNLLQRSRSLPEVTTFTSCGSDLVDL